MVGWALLGGVLLGGGELPAQALTGTLTGTLTSAPTTTAAAALAGSDGPSSTAPTTGAPLAPPSSQPAAPATPPTTTITSQQELVVTAEHRAALDLARVAVDHFTAAIATDQGAIATDQKKLVATQAQQAATAGRLAADQAALLGDRRTLSAAEAALSLDRAQLRVIAVGMYTGDFTDPPPSSGQSLILAQQQVIDTSEAEVVAGLVDHNLRRDVGAESRDRDRVGRAVTLVGQDQQDLTQAVLAVADGLHQLAQDQATLDSDEKGQTEAVQQLGSVEAALTAALASLNGPADTPPGQVSLLGGAAIDARQLVGWYNSQGYVDLTSTPISELANWYLQAGTAEGVRGDLAFAQAILETGGFASPDAVDLNNYAGIGHCDTCPAGWAFPSPELGVLGHVQLLRIFADAGPGPAQAPRPVLPVLTPAAQGRAGCCATVESLTGVWATDPTYSQQILQIYASMLDYALSSPDLVTQSAPPTSTTTSQVPTTLNNPPVPSSAAVPAAH